MTTMGGLITSKEVRMKYCCDKMVDWIKHDIIEIDVDNWKWFIVSECDGRCKEEIYYCPFCGEKLK